MANPAAAARLRIIILLIVIVCAALTSAQQATAPAPAAQKPAPLLFKSAVSVVALDVSVLDKNREPVRGLTADDFTVLEDGRPQKVVAFTAVDVPDPPKDLPPAAWLRDVSPDVQSNVAAEAPEGRLFVLLMDDALMPFDPSAVQNAKKIARSVIDRMSPGDQMAVVFSAHSDGTQDFTTDRAKLVKAVDSLQAGASGYAMGWDNAVEAPPGRGAAARSPGWIIPIDGDANFRLASLRTLRDVAATLIAAPKRRKALILVGPGVPVDLEATVPRNIGGNVQLGLPIGVREANAQLTRELPTLYDAMRRANVTIYPIDPTGLGGVNTFVTGVLRGLRATSSGTASPSPNQDWYGLWPTAPHPQDVGRRVAQQDLDFMLTAADNTGGHAVVNTNDFDAGITQIFRENASYYVLGYDAPGKNTPGSTHRLTVKVNRPGVDIRTRSGYDMPEPDKSDDKHPAPPATAKAVAGPIAVGDVPMEVFATAVAVPGRAEAAVAVALGIRQPAVATRTAQTFQLRTSVFTPDGKLLKTFEQSGQVTLSPSTDVSRYELLSQVSLKPGRYELRLATHVDATDTTSSVYADIEVPDFAKLPLSLSGVMLEATPALTGGPRDTFSGVLPVVPTSKRDLATTDQVTAYWQLYEGGETPLAPASLSVHIVNDHDVTMFSSETTVSAEAFPSGQRSSGQRITLPLSTLAPGQYLLTIDARLGDKAARRDVRFTVVR